MTLRNKLNALTADKRIALFNEFFPYTPVGEFISIWKMEDFDEVIKDYRISPTRLAWMMKRKSSTFDLDDEYFRILDFSIESFNADEADNVGASVDDLMEFFNDYERYHELIDKLADNHIIY